jgi:hypothetical protein
MVGPARHSPPAAWACGLKVEILKMKLELTTDEAHFLSQQLARRASDLERDLVRTDKHELQHALALDLARLQQIQRTIELLASGGAKYG